MINCIFALGFAPCTFNIMSFFFTRELTLILHQHEIKRFLVIHVYDHACFALKICILTIKYCLCLRSQIPATFDKKVFSVPTINCFGCSSNILS